MLTILIGRAKTGKSDQVLRRMAELGESSQQILLVPEHASHQAEVDVCSACFRMLARIPEKGTKASLRNSTMVWMTSVMKFTSQQPQRRHVSARMARQHSRMASALLSPTSSIHFRA